jgi:putative CocE/NonD family hydrolase
MGDAYRDMVLPGGSVNTGFIPLWLGLITAGSIVPLPGAILGSPAGAVQTLETLIAHAKGLYNIAAGISVSALLGGDYAYDGKFWRDRSPLESVDRIDVPAFIVGGLHDIFQRGEPLLYERLKQRVTAKLLIGPWTHLGTGSGLPADGVPRLQEIELRWFDHYLKGINTRIGAIPAVTQYELGAGHYKTHKTWPDPGITPVRRYLHAGGVLDESIPAAAESPDTFIQQPLAGICTQSTSQWTAGAGQPLPCTTDDRLNEPTGVTYTTAPLRSPLRFDGPILAFLWVKTSARDAVIDVRITDVAPDGTSTELTGGWLAASFRVVQRSRSRIVAGQLLQPWHPFTRTSVLRVPANRPVPLAVEVFPTDALIAAGHRLRVYVGPSDFPHALPPAPQLMNSLSGPVTVLHDSKYRSYVELPGL